MEPRPRHIACGRRLAELPGGSRLFSAAAMARVPYFASISRGCSGRTLSGFRQDRRSRTLFPGPRLLSGSPIAQHQKYQANSPMPGGHPKTQPQARNDPDRYAQGRTVHLRCLNAHTGQTLGRPGSGSPRARGNAGGPHPRGYPPSRDQRRARRNRNECCAQRWPPKSQSDAVRPSADELNRLPRALMVPSRAEVVRPAPRERRPQAPRHRRRGRDTRSHRCPTGRSATSP